MSATGPWAGQQCTSPFPHNPPRMDSPSRGSHFPAPISHWVATSQVPSASHLGLHPLPTGTLRKQGQPRPRAPSGKDGGGGGAQVPSRLLLKGVQAPETPSLPGHCLAGQGICLGPGFGGGHGVCARPLPRAPFPILQGSRPLMSRTRWRAAPWGRSQGRGPGKSKTPQKPALLSWETAGEPSLSWVPPGTPSPVLGTRAHASNDTNGTNRDQSRQRWSRSAQGRLGGARRKEGIPRKTKPDKPETPAPGGLTASPSYSARWGNWSKPRVKGTRLQGQPSERDALAIGRVHAHLLTPPEDLGVEAWEGEGWTSPQRGRLGRPAGTPLGLGGGIGHLAWLSSTELRPPAQAREERARRDRRAPSQGERKPA